MGSIAVLERYCSLQRYLFKFMPRIFEFREKYWEAPGWREGAQPSVVERQRSRY